LIGQYYFDGDGKRVKKVVPNGETTIFVYDAGGNSVSTGGGYIIGGAACPQPTVAAVAANTLERPSDHLLSVLGSSARYGKFPGGDILANLQPLVTHPEFDRHVLV
jgi:hypothetical protein